MYIPHHFKVNDPALLRPLMERFSFATLVTADGGHPFATHLPFVVGEDGRLRSHMARANPQWRTLAAGGEALVIFQGHHAYISPRWYTAHPSVPTWNYMVVHAYGPARLIAERSEAVALLAEVVDKHEAGAENPWRMELPDDFVDNRLRALVAFEIEPTRVEGKFKLSQNRPDADRAQVIAALRASDDALERELASLMEQPR